MTYFYILVAICLLLIFVFYAPFRGLGKFLYSLSNNIESKIAGLTTFNCNVSDKNITYFDNLNHGKPTLLLLHGFSADRYIWLRFAKHFKNTHRVIIPDLLGHGNNAYSAADNYSSYTQASMLVDFVKTLELQNISVVGNSMGGMIAAILLKDHGEIFERSVLLDPAGAKSEFAIEASQHRENPFIMSSLDDFRVFYSASMAKPPPIPKSVLNYLGHKNYVSIREQLDHQFTDFFNLDDFFTTPIDIQASKCLIIWGELDGLLPVSDAEFWKKLTKSEPIVFKGIGHMPMVECSAKTANEVRRFLPTTG